MNHNIFRIIIEYFKEETEFINNDWRNKYYIQKNTFNDWFKDFNQSKNDIKTKIKGIPVP